MRSLAGVPTAYFMWLTPDSVAAACLFTMTAGILGVVHYVTHR
jgi:hypothetical protein